MAQPDALHVAVTQRLADVGVTVTPVQVCRVDESRRSSHQPPFGVLGRFIANVLEDEENSHA